MTRPLPIAVVGRAGLFPGAGDLETFWSNILEGVDAARDVPDGRWAVAREELRGANPPEHDQLYSERACFLEDFDLGPAVDGLELPPDVGSLDPLVRLVLRVGAEAWADASTGQVDRSRAGIILANIALPTDSSSALTREILGRSLEEVALGGDASVASDAGLGSDPRNRYVTGYPAALLASSLGLGGGSWTLDAACASSLYAIHLACEELRAGRSDLMLAGGASRPECLYTQVGFSQLRALSPSGRCSPFDARGDGLVVGEGAGIFALKRLDDALEAGDTIHGLIHGVGLSNDVGGSLLAPDTEGQQRAMREAYERAGWNPRDVGLVECHGTGTPRGDGVELESLGTVFGPEAAGVVVGSVKSNVGHLLTGAGAAGFMKVLKALEHRMLPPSANFDPGSAHPKLESSPFRVLTQGEPWPSDGPRRAAVSGFGFGGINAHLLVEEWAGQEPEEAGAEAIEADWPALAIVGMGAHFGNLETLTEFQHAALTGDPALTDRPAGRWKGVAESSWLRRLGDAARSMPGAWIDELTIPLGRFRIPPSELPGILPQQLLALEVAAAAFEDAGLDWQSAAPRLRAGVLVGMGLDLETTSFHLGWVLPAIARRWLQLHGGDLAPELGEAWIEELEASLGSGLDANKTVGALGGIIASRIARELRLGGPSFALSAEDGSGLRSVEVAARMLQRREVDLMVVGAVDLAGDIRAVLAQDALEPWSRSGVARPFDARCDGPVVGEGAAALVLKRLDDARRDGDRVYAVLRGCGGGADWAQALERAYQDAGVDPADVSLVEVAATGSPEADRTEAEALLDFFPPSERPRCALSAVRSVVGDPGAAGGLASLVKAALALFHEVLPGAPGFERPLEGLPWAGAGFHVPRAAQYWQRDRRGGVRRVGVSDRSFDGNCMHLVLEGLEREDDAGIEGSDAPLGPRAYGLFAFDEQEIPALKALAAGVLDGGVEALAARWYRQRGGKGSRALAVSSVEELLRRVDLPQVALPRLEGEVAWVFPGSGSHYVGMGRSLGAAFPAVQRQIDASTEQLASQLAVDAVTPWRLDWSGDWEGDALRSFESETRRVIFGQVAHGVAVGKTLSWFGLHPDAVIGYSLGESAGLFASGAWSARDLMFERMLSSSLFEDELVGACTVAAEHYGTPAPDWVAAVLQASADQVADVLSGSLRLLIVNAPGECVVGGLRSELAEAAAALGCGDPIFLEGVPTVHSELVDPVAEAYRALHVLPTEAPQGVRFYSGNWGRSYPLDSDESAADSIVANATGGLDFQRTIEQAWEDGVRVFIEGGPGSSCTRMVDRILGDRPHLALSACQRGVDGGLALLRALAKLIRVGVDVDLEPLYGESSGVWLPQADSEVPSLRMPTGGRVPRPTPLAALHRPAVPDAAPVTPVATALAAAPVSRPAVGGGMSLVEHSSALLTNQLQISADNARVHGVFLEADANFRRLREQLTAMIAGVQVEQPALADLQPPPPVAVSLPTEQPLPQVAFDRDLCMEFAVGSIGKMLGPMFAEVDSHPTRVRLPDEPLMLVDRILTVEGEPGSLGSGRVVTEHDVLPGAWYLDGGRCPVCISVEAGQADLFLSGYLGIDLETKGLRVYRLLDAEVCFHRDLPCVGETVRYDIHIDKFIRQGSTWMFFFRFEGWIGDEHLISMRDGCAGFFSSEQLESGKGIVEEDPSEIPPRRPGTTPLTPLVAMGRESYDAEALDALRRGDLEACFGAGFAGRTLAPALRLPEGRMRLIHRILELDPQGGSYGLGRIEGEADVDPEGWYLTCHFVDDMVMPGTLMYEGCLHTLRIYLLRLGWVIEETGEDVHYAPIPGEASALRCRGQVLDTSKVIRYRIDIKELGYDPEPYVLADAVMFVDGKKAVRFRNVSYRLQGLDEPTLAAGWEAAGLAPPARVFGPDEILAYAVGKPSEGFGERYRIFDEERVLARLPGPPFLFVDRVTRVEATPWVLAPTDWVHSEWDVAKDAWFFAANGSRTMPFCIFLEAALQPCGWLAAYLGSALRSDGQLHFRNLEGTATLHREIPADIGTIASRVRLTSFSEAGGMIIQGFDMELSAGGEVLYEGSTRFGFFPTASLAAQVGIRDADERLYLPGGEACPRPLSRLAPLSPTEAAELGLPTTESLALPGGALLMLDEVEDLRLDSGPQGLGFALGSLRVDPEAWFFAAHFYQDPVIPGSLGLESFIQLMKLLAMERWPDKTGSHRFESLAVGRSHSWIYRGQVVPENERVEVRCWVDSVEDGDEPVLVCSGFLLADGKPIYEMKGFPLRLVRT